MDDKDLRTCGNFLKEENRLLPSSRPGCLDGDGMKSGGWGVVVSSLSLKVCSLSTSPVPAGSFDEPSEARRTIWLNSVSHRDDFYGGVGQGMAPGLTASSRKACGCLYT